MSASIVHCTGCDETWETSTPTLGALCGRGYVRMATPAERADYLSDVPACNCDSDSAWQLGIGCPIH